MKVQGDGQKYYANIFSKSFVLSSLLSLLTGFSQHYDKLPSKQSHRILQVTSNLSSTPQKSDFYHFSINESPDSDEDTLV